MLICAIFKRSDVIRLGNICQNGCQEMHQMQMHIQQQYVTQCTVLVTRCTILMQNVTFRLILYSAPAVFFRDCVTVIFVFIITVIIITIHWP